MDQKLIWCTIFLFIVACSPKNKDRQKNELESTFIDSTDFKYVGLKKFDIQEWYEGRIQLKALNKKEVEKYYQYCLRPNTADTTNYYFYSLQKNLAAEKSITIIDGATGGQPNLRMLIYDKNDSLIGFHPVAGIVNNSNWNVHGVMVSEEVNDTIYRSTEVTEYEGEFDSGKISRDCTITKFVIGLGYMKEAKILEKQKYELK